VSVLRRRIGASRGGDSIAEEAPPEPRTPGGLTRRLIAASGLLALIVGGAFVVLLLAVGDLRDAGRRSDHSQEVLIAANELERLLLDLETGERGFILTHQERFLEPWNGARARFPRRAAALLGLVADDPVAQRRAARIAQDERAYIDEYSVPLVRAARRGDPSVRSVSTADPGKRRVDAMRVEFDQLLAAERRTSASSNASADAAARRASAAAAVGLAGSIALIAAFTAFLARAIVRPVRRAATMAGRIAGGDLSARMPQTGPGEVGELERTFNVMASSLERSRDELAELADEQTALRRVATLVAQEVATADVFEAVAREVGLQCDADFARMERFEPDGAVTAIAAWSRSGAAHLAVDTRFALEGPSIAAQVHETGRPARVDSFEGATGPIAREAQAAGIRASVGCPIVVGGRTWGVIAASTTREAPFPPDTESRIADFTELAATAIANAHAREELRRAVDEQAALRRVATLVAEGVPPGELFRAVTEEVGTLLGADLAATARLDADDGLTVLATWAATGEHPEIATRWPLDEADLATIVLRTGRPARMDGRDGIHPRLAVTREKLGIRSSVAGPIVVEGRPWGGLVVHSKQAEPLPADTESRLMNFAQLVATAMSNVKARAEVQRLADEQAALRRVATLVARAAPPVALFAAVVEEVGRLLGADLTALGRYDPDGTVTTVAGWSRTGNGPPIGYRAILDQRNVSTLVFETGRPARVESYGDDAARRRVPWLVATGVRAGVGAPISVEDRLWGVMIVASTSDVPPPRGTEERLADFTELVATAIANAETQAELTASRARIVATADDTRRRIERDLHDGAQQRLVSLALQLRGAQAGVPRELGELEAELVDIAGGITDVLDELREMARGIHPAILAEGGLGPALKTLARRSAVPVELDVRTTGRLPEPIEVGAYFVVSEALTNVAKHARASSVVVDVEAVDGVLRLSVRDDGVGGADFERGSGLVGLKDRVEALGGRIAVESARGAGTALRVELPLSDERDPSG
jgi:signal transduction histidine kinase/HAMP domain-containing protein